MQPVTRDNHRTPWQTFGVRLEGGAARVCVWAPDARSVAVVEPDRVSFSSETGTENETRSGMTRSVLHPDEDGVFSGIVPELVPGSRYRFILDDDLAIPDPASRFQPEGVHGPSEVVDASSFVWRHPPPPRMRMDRASIYELHVGTFTTAGTFHAAVERLPWLADLGVSAIELMPVAAFPGGRNWGYDGAALFAPSETYGRPDDLRHLVDAAHALGLSVILDVVYNHFGPSGAYAVAASRRFLSDRHTSPWGRAVNLDGAGARQVRRFFIENALHWLIDYRIDGLRLDATHALVDASGVHVLAELSDVVRQTLGDREVLLIAEDHRNLRTLVTAREAGGSGLDAVWADDFHHVVRRMTAGDDEAYFRDYRGDVDELATTLRRGWLYQGEMSVHHGAPRGTDPRGLDLWRAVIALQNHDQTGNRALGDRLHHTIDLAAWRALSVLLVLAPETPLLFMGQEWAASSPFQYFTDHEPELGDRVREGRRDEFRLFRAFHDRKRRAAIPDPQAIETFLRSKLDWDEVSRPPHAGTAALYRRLLRMRRRLEPEAASGDVGADRVSASGPDALWLRRRTDDGRELLIVVRIRGRGSVSVPLRQPFAAAWNVELDTEDSSFTNDRMPATLALDDGRIGFARPGAIVLGSRRV